MQSADVFALTPPNVVDPALAIAACRAGAVGVFDLELAPEGPAVWSALGRLARYTTGAYGVKLGVASGFVLDALLRDGPPGRLRWVLLAGGDHAQLAGWVQRLRRHAVRVLLEAVNLDEIRLGEQLGVDGLVLKGHEAGGRVGAETAFVLLQRWFAHGKRLPVWVQGGIGLNTAAACVAGGAAGVVLDGQLLLAKESPLDEAARQRLAAFDGSETLLLGERLGAAYRFFTRPGWTAGDELAQEEERILASPQSAAEKLEAWRQTVATLAAVPGERGLWLLGQDAAFAKPLTDRFVTVGGIVQEIVRRANQQLATARQLEPLAENAALAKRHRTRYPIVQGPMTRVSDTAPFAEAVAKAGALPFLALALLRKTETEALLRETQARVGGRSWGVGILGFVPPEIRNEQMAAVRQYKPPFALIAGGRPDQARELEKEGIVTYLHVPSPGLLRMFLKDGARRFVFEGRECGGHVGPRTSFVLWETMCEILLEHIGPNGKGDDLNVVFAGGVHDAHSASMVAALAASLAERGVAVGVLMGTAYLFTHEAVTSGGIVPRFQEEAIACKDTVLLQTGPGHAIRCIPTPYFDHFEAEKRRLQAEGKSHEEIVKALEWMNIGRLRIASKGIDRAPDGAATKFVTLPDDEQVKRGMYMIGQVATLHDRVLSMAELHHDVSVQGTERLRQTAEKVPATPAATVLEKPCDVAIIGMACYYPKGNGLWDYWENILNKVNAVGEIPASHWDWRLFYDPDPRTPDKIISKWGGFLDDITFDPLNYGITPNSLYSIEPLQLYLLEAVRLAMIDAGYADRPYDREKVAAILGVGGGGSPMAMSYGFRTCMPLLDTIPGLSMKSDEVMARGKELLPEWTEDSFPGILFNVAVGRVANRFNFGGPNYAIDAACGSSLAAVQACVRELEVGTSDLAVAMGADTVQTAYAYMAFSKTHALSPRGRCRPFDAGADGIALSEGIGVVVLKRLADAERDGDRIYGVIKGMGASSDGRDKGLTAPRPEGQLRALRRAYAKAGVSPSLVTLVEAHGTGTVVGDQTEALALGQIFREAGAAPQSCAIGSVKSMIGHSKCAAGIGGLIKTAMAMYHKVLPPTLVEKPNPKGNFEDGPLYLNTEPRPWVHGANHPRYAGVSAFGFGGTNFHVVLEDYEGDYLQEPTCGMRRWPAELMVWRRPTKQALVQAVEQTYQSLAKGGRPDLTALAAALWKASRGPADQPTLAVVATSLDDLRDKLSAAFEVLRSTKDRASDPRGIFYAEKPTWLASERQPEASRGCQPEASRGCQPEASRGCQPPEFPKVAFLFPGQGSQYLNMLAQVALTFPEVRAAFDAAERSLQGRLEKPLGKYIFPSSTFSPEKEQQAKQDLTRTDVAQPAVGAASLGMFRLLTALGVEPEFLAGHSYGEYTALCAAGAMAEDDLIRLSHRRGQVIVAATAQQASGMAAVEAGAAATAEAIKGLAGVGVANSNGPNQTVISGSEEGLQAALARLKEKGLRAQRIPVACAFHSPLVAAAQKPLAEALAEANLTAPRRTVFSNTTAKPHATAPSAIAALLTEHLTAPVLFQNEIEAMYDAGARIFVEVGPQGVLTGLVNQTLAGKPFLAVASDNKSRPGLVQLAHLLGQLLAHGVPVQLDRLFQGRGLKTIDLNRLDEETGKPKVTPTTWLVNSVRSRPFNAPERRLIGQALPEGAAAAPAPVATTPKPTPQVSPAGEKKHMPEPTTPAHINGVAAAPPPATPTIPVTDDAAQVMLRFQDLMARFLDTQKTVMTAFLHGGAAVPLPDLAAPAPVATVTAPPSINGHHPAPVSEPPVAAEPPAAPAPAPEPAPAAEETPAQPALNREWFATRLLDLVSGRTGYPKDMLGLDLDLEADLGIDSIKRIEILGELASELDGSNSELGGSLEMEKLTTIKTLRGILDYFESLLDGPKAQPAAAAESLNGHADKPARQLEVQRGLVRLVDTPLPTRPAPLLPSGVVLFTDDGRGVAREMAGRLADFGQKTALIRHGAPEENGQEDVYHADLTNPEAVNDLLACVREEHGDIAGLVHLLPLAEAPAGEKPAERMRREVRSLYLLARGLGDDLRRAGGEGGALLLAATALGGGLGFGTDPLPESYFAGHGGVIGFTKCLAYEWPEVLVRVVDLDADGKPEELAEKLLGELGDQEGPLEVGYQGARRVTWEPFQAPLLPDPNAAPLLDADSTVLITGGARGITAAIALELAQRYQPNLVLVGRSAEPEAEEADTAALTTAGEIKAALIARHQREGRPAAPAAIETAYQRLMQDREIRDNLQKLRDAGAKVHYFQADVRDEKALGGVLDEIDRRFGKLDGVLHGAGVIEDRLVRDKTPESFDRVFGTKTASAFTLSKKLKPESLKFCVFFASIASRYGNKGQSDYAAANEVLSKLAWQLDREWPCRVISVAWGPWSGVGMVADLEKHLVQRGLKLISPEEGPVFLVEELLYGCKGQTEVVIAGGAEHVAQPIKRERPVATAAK